MTEEITLKLHIVTGVKTVVHAVESAKNAAYAMMRYMDSTV